MKISCVGLSAACRALASGHTIWCEETGEGVSIMRDCSVRHARKVLVRFMGVIRVRHRTWYYIQKEES